ncbi:hypothetical protein [Wolbachia endosymbiont of Pentidionis agamae]|uniref:hypothetical protein n=1 Tax=Wolbachia endosymbiont of Pentidionis agamae TaxID=3110435 RepID=UPI002FCF1C46
MNLELWNKLFNRAVDSTQSGGEVVNVLLSSMREEKELSNDDKEEIDFTLKQWEKVKNDINACFWVGGQETRSLYPLLHIAIMCANEKILEALIKAGANPLIKDEDGKTAKQLLNKINPSLKAREDFESFKDTANPILEEAEKQFRDAQNGVNALFWKNEFNLEQSNPYRPQVLQRYLSVFFPLMEKEGWTALSKKSNSDILKFVKEKKMALALNVAVATIAGICIGYALGICVLSSGLGVTAAIAIGSISGLISGISSLGLLTNASEGRSQMKGEQKLMTGRQKLEVLGFGLAGAALAITAVVLPLILVLPLHVPLIVTAALGFGMFGYSVSASISTDCIIKKENKSSLTDKMSSLSLAGGIESIIMLIPTAFLGFKVLANLTSNICTSIKNSLDKEPKSLLTETVSLSNENTHHV